MTQKLVNIQNTRGTRNMHIHELPLHMKSTWDGHLQRNCLKFDMNHILVILPKNTIHVTTTTVVHFEYLFLQHTINISFNITSTMYWPQWKQTFQDCLQSPATTASHRIRPGCCHHCQRPETASHFVQHKGSVRPRHMITSQCLSL